VRFLIEPQMSELKATSFSVKFEILKFQNYVTVFCPMSEILDL